MKRTPLHRGGRDSQSMAVRMVRELQMFQPSLYVITYKRDRGEWRCTIQSRNRRITAGAHSLLDLPSPAEIIEAGSRLDWMKDR